MFARLVVDVLRRWAGVYGLVTLLVAGVTFSLHLPDLQPLPGDVGKSLALFLAFLFCPQMAMCAFVRREFQTLPLSRRDFWLARWLIGTVGTATWVMLARTIAVSVAIASGIPVAESAASVLLTWPIVFVYSGAFFGLAAQAAKSPALVALFRRRTDPRVVGKTMLIIGGLAGAGGVLGMWSGLPQRALWPANWEGFWGPPGIAAIVALMLTLAGYRHQPASGPGHSPFRGSSLDTSPGSPLMTPMGRRFSGISLLLWQGLVRGLGTGIFLLTLMLVLQPHRPTFAERILEIAHRFDEGIVFKYAGGFLPIIDSIWFPLIVIGSFNPLTPSMRHLRTLPMSTATLNALLFAGPLPHFVSLIGGFTILHVLFAGSLPHFDVASCMLSFGMAALAHTWQLTFGGMFRMFFSWTLVIAVVLVVGVAMRFTLPSPLDLLMLPATIGASMMMAAAVWNHSLLTRRTSLYRAPLWPSDPA